jgi:hypothetical protein
MERAAILTVTGSLLTAGVALGAGVLEAAGAGADFESVVAVWLLHAASAIVSKLRAAELAIIFFLYKEPTSSTFEFVEESIIRYLQTHAKSGDRHLHPSGSCAEIETVSRYFVMSHKHKRLCINLD